MTRPVVDAGRPIRIGIDVSALMPKATGVDTYIRGLVRHLARLAEGRRPS
jgi:hypothetical protein